ncbi:hypothetical protein [Arthrobacter rhombi]|uniref:hypothetical protein n=1 Tax=Arthrobacter rhombi TaxID=71253 RepID=UPI003FD30B1A
MATRYGYRLYKVRLRHGYKRSDLSFDTAKLGTDDKPIAFVESMRRIYESLEGVTRTEALKYSDRSKTPNPDEDGSGADTEDTSPHIRLLSADFHDHRIDFTFRFGRRGSHDLAMGPSTSDDSPLDGKAPTNPYRAFLYLPVKGTLAVLVAETRGRLCPGDDLLRLLGVTSKEQDEERVDGKRIGWWRFLPTPLTDQAQLDRMLRQGSAKGACLIKHFETSDGERRTKEIQVRQDWLPAGKVKAAKTLVHTWGGVADEDELDADVDGKTAMQSVSELLEVDVDFEEYTDAGVLWEDPDGNTTTVKPDTFKDVFTYRIGALGRRPSDNDIRYAAAARLSDMAPKMNVELVL